MRRGRVLVFSFFLSLFSRFVFVFSVCLSELPVGQCIKQVKDSTINPKNFLKLFSIVESFYWERSVSPVVIGLVKSKTNFFTTKLTPKTNFFTTENKLFYYIKYTKQTFVFRWFVFVCFLLYLHKPKPLKNEPNIYHSAQ